MTGDMERDCHGGDGSLICVLCAPRAAGYSTANSVVRADFDSVWSGNSGCNAMHSIAFWLLLLLLLTWPCRASAPSSCSQQHWFCLFCPFSDTSGSGHQRQSPKSVPRYRGAGVQGYMDTRAQAHAGL